jgi:hypothetical protein
MLDVIREVLAGLLLAFGALGVVTNLGCLWTVYVFRKRRGVSLVPFVGGLCGAAGLLVCPARGVAYYAWVPLVVDPGCLLLLACFAVFLWRRK